MGGLGDVDINIVKGEVGVVIGVVEVAHDVGIVGCTAAGFGCGEELAKFHIAVVVGGIVETVVITSAVGGVVIIVADTIPSWGHCGELWGWVAIHAIGVGLGGWKGCRGGT